MMTASTLFLRSAIGCTADRDRSVGIVATRLVDPVGEIGARTRKTDPFPRGHCAISPVERVREISLLGICQQLCEEDCRWHRREDDFALLHCGQKVILVCSRKLREVLAVRFL